jgi:hypothetical protein
MAKKILLATVMVFAMGVAASAQITISGGAALSSAEVDATGYDGEIGVGGNVYIDYILPISVPLSLGLEFGVDTSTFDKDDPRNEVTALAIPILLRAAWHFDLHPRFDLYLVGKIGYVIGNATGPYIDTRKDAGVNIKTAGGVGVGFDIGAAFYFTPYAGVFAEAGFDRYEGGLKGTYQGVSETVDIMFSRFFTAGLSLKR